VTEGDGTGTEAAVEGYRVAGKTATAQKTDPATGRYSLDAYIASFVGFVPAKDPVVAIAVTVDEPMLDHAGGNVAAPVFRRVADMVLKYKGLKPHGTKSANLAELANQPDPAHQTYEALRRAKGGKPPVQEVKKSGQVASGQVRVPDMTGWPLRQAIVHAMELGTKPNVRGTGLLARQTPSPGEVMPKGGSILLEFEPAS
jgi:cell division protein FtsI (penicillin-binding protein 3)